MDKTDLIIFDLDGTILDTLEDLRNSLNHVLTDHGFPMRTLEETRQMVGNGIRRLIQQAVPSGTEDGTIDQLYREFLPWYQDHCAVKTRPYDGIPELLRALRAQGIRTAVLSNKADPAVHILCEQYFPGCFDATAGEIPGRKRKPAPDGADHLLEKLKAERSSTLLLGDSEVDLATAKNAGLDFLGAAWGFRGYAFLKEQGARRIAERPGDVLALLGKE